MGTLDTFALDIEDKAACRGIAYGMLIGAPPVIAANVLVAGMAVWSTWAGRSAGRAAAES